MSAVLLSWLFVFVTSKFLEDVCDSTALDSLQETQHGRVAWRDQGAAAEGPK